MSNPDAPKIEFPCAAYPIKVIGRNQVGFEKLVIDVISVHASDVNHTGAQASSNGRFVSVRCHITATGPDQLKAIHKALMATGLVQMVI
ncbi:DUF493 family protein [Motiliproteus sediminis]|uniref:DUF493 family protein n=1 Tax=Motiliproteus sediminis TaxID=1468178 RepID=UPI001AEF5CAD|nr:DUF493 family protein [Motiliproteus sediminis]